MNIKEIDLSNQEKDVKVQTEAENGLPKGRRLLHNDFLRLKEDALMEWVGGVEYQNYINPDLSDPRTRGNR